MASYLTLAPEWDQISVTQLRELGSVKWTAFPGTLGAWVAEMDFGTAPVISQALEKAIHSQQFGYLSPELTLRLGEAFATFARHRYGWAVNPACVRPLPDVLAAFAVVVEQWTRPGDRIILPTPAYPPFRPVIEAAGRQVIEVPLIFDDDGRPTHDLTAIETAFAAGGTLLVVVNPHNPTGRVFEASELAALADIVVRHRGRVFADEIHAPITFPGHAHVPYAAISTMTAAHTATATSASKAWNLAGLKASQLIWADAHLAKRWELIGTWPEHVTSTLGVIAHIAAYESGLPWLEEALRYLDGNRRFVTDALAGTGIGYRESEGTYLAWLDFRGLLQTQPNPAAWLRERAGVALNEGADWGAAGIGHARLTLATPRPILEEILNRIRTAVGSR
ncbi:MAG: aminotransferase class I/II-fold pyridoxal phosphate-dependent enzyme [Promicromonosporaceae bacterium]|nr:aminotransferase class I/II-fold pyridoxal phosphate-dependent enzyme [Promicromonosporaceae bacterium]